MHRKTKAKERTAVMGAFDFKKEYKEFYLPKNTPEIVTIPKMNYIDVRGSGDPNLEGGAYQQALGVLYAVAYTLKMSYKGSHKIDGVARKILCKVQKSG